MALFSRIDVGTWLPAPVAAGPFTGLQGGAVAGLLTAEIEAKAREEGLGEAVSTSVWFLRPTPEAPLSTELRQVHGGGRVSVFDSTLRPAGEAAPCATARVTLVRDRRFRDPAPPAPGEPIVPEGLPLRRSPARDRPWLMDAAEMREADGVVWFKWREAVVQDAGALASTLPAADFAHGLIRPEGLAAALPNPNLTVQLARRPEGQWLGVRPRTLWDFERGLGMGLADLLDVRGLVGCVSMVAVMTPLR